jgi:hypothetical protein
VRLPIPVREHELEPLGAGNLAYLDGEPAVDRPGHLGDEPARGLLILGHEAFS